MKRAKLPLAGALLGALVASTGVHAQQVESVMVEAARISAATVDFSPSGIPVKAISLTYKVKISDLDLTSPEGPAALEKRVRAAALSACHDLSRPQAGTGTPLPFPMIETMPRIPGYDPATGLWIPEGPSDLQRVIFTSSAFKFRIDLPAWIVIGSLPVFSLLIGMLLSVSMSRSVTRPISQLAYATRAIGQRDLGYRVQTHGSRELQELAQSFNRMAEQLEHTATTRRNLMADVAHELRTPLADLDGNLRAILEGVHALNEDEIALLYEQTHHLNRLVDDLRDLSLAESNQLSLNRREVDLARLARESAAWAPSR